MKKVIGLLLVMAVSACGKQAVDNEMTGQVKRVMRNTPLICPTYNDADISMGVLRNGVGSMSKEDVWVYVPDRVMYEKLKAASASGDLVKITYDVQRFVICTEDHWVTDVQLVK